MVPARSFAFTDGSGWAMFPYIVKMVLEAYRRYTQLQSMIEQGRNHMDYLRLVNSGLNDIAGLIAALPVKDERVLEDLRTLQKAMKTIDEVYGKIPKSPEAQMQFLHDQTIAESFKVTNAVKDYAESQEANATRAFQMSGQMSPKGAERLAAATNAQVLHAVTQVLKVNGQMLKLQGEEFALKNKQEKDSVSHFNRVNGDVKASLAGFSGNFALPKF